MVAGPKRKRHCRRASAALAEMLFGLLLDTLACAATIEKVNTASVCNQSEERLTEEQSFN